MEKAFEAGEALSRTLLTPAARGVAMEALSAQRYSEMRDSTEGMIFVCNEVVVARPDGEYFLHLAERFGRPADVEFFQNRLRTYPEGVWPSYVEQQTDITGCTRFGNDELIERYRDWRRFRERHPDAYVAAVAHELQEIEREMADSTCACGSREEVRASLRTFANVFADSPASSRVKERLSALDNGHSDIRFACVSG